MAKTLELPVLGNSMEEGTITQWFKAEGESVAKGEALYEVMTDKVNMEVEAPEAGVLHKILAAADATVLVGGPVAILGAVGEDVSTLLAPSTPNPGGGGEDKSGKEDAASGASRLIPAPHSALPGLEVGGASIFASPRARRCADENGVDIALLVGRGTGVDGRVVEADVIVFHEEEQAQKKSAPRVSPLAQRVANEHGVAVGDVTGTGHAGKVTQEDVKRSVAPSCPIPSPVSTRAMAPAGTTIVTLRGMRKMVAEAVTRSARTAPHVTLTLPVDMSEAARFRAQVLPAIEKAVGVRVSFTDIIAKATARVLKDHPYLNSTLAEDEITLYESVNLGVAVSLGVEGLIVPVVRDVQALSLGEFSRALKDLAARAKTGGLTTGEVTGGTFSISNLGTSGVTQFDPIIVPPQAAILGVCTIVDTIVAVGGLPAVRPMMNLCLSFDHRIMDGAPAAAFLAQLKETLEQPYLIFA